MNGFEDPNFAHLASYGILDLHGDRASDLRPAFMQILAQNRLALIDVEFQQLSFSIQGDEAIDLDDADLFSRLFSMTTASPSTESLIFSSDGPSIKKDGNSQDRWLR
jgi:hypothetical protein